MPKVRRRVATTAAAALTLLASQASGSNADPRVLSGSDIAVEDPISLVGNTGCVAQNGPTSHEPKSLLSSISGG